MRDVRFGIRVENIVWIKTFQWLKMGVQLKVDERNVFNNEEQSKK